MAVRSASNGSKPRNLGLGNKQEEPKPKVKEDVDYGILKKPNIGEVHFGNYSLKPWYGNTAYFDPRGNGSALGIEAEPSKRPKKAGDTIGEDSYWIDELFVCEYCFKYTTNGDHISSHRVNCNYNKELPTVGKLVYRDDESPYLIRQVKGYVDELFCQNLCLFSKLFLDDKSVYYNTSQFDFYVVYGFDKLDILSYNSKLPNFKPMGFFSKELVSWDGDNNLACICVFPPYQRRHLGSLLIEFLYELARVTPGQYFSGPEFPLSPYGKVTYLNFWAKKLSVLLLQNYSNSKHFTIKDIAVKTGYRNEDIMIALDYMKVLMTSEKGLVLSLENLTSWCSSHSIDPSQESSMIKDDCLLI